MIYIAITFYLIMLPIILCLIHCDLPNQLFSNSIGLQIPLDRGNVREGGLSWERSIVVLA